VVVVKAAEDYRHRRDNCQHDEGMKDDDAEQDRTPADDAHQRDDVLDAVLKHDLVRGLALQVVVKAAEDH